MNALLKIDEIDVRDYEGLIFDCDGTLTHSMPLHYIAWRDTLAAIGIDFPEKRFYAMGGMPSEKIVAILAEEQGRTADPVQVSVDKEDAFYTLLPKLQRVQQVCDLAIHQSSLMPCAVASGGIREAVTKQLEVVGMLEFFPIMVTAEDTERHKPEPDVFLRAAELLQVPSSRCLVFEDSVLGFQAAERAGMKCVDVRSLTMQSSAT